MPNVVEVVFYFANPTQDANGNPILSSPPESHTLTWQQVVDNAGFSLSTGESMFTELPNPSDPNNLRVVNGFYFGTGRYGSLLGIQYKYDDHSDGWIKTILRKSSNGQNLDMIVGNWIKGLSYQEVTTHAKWTGKPYIGLENDYIDVIIERIIPDVPPPDPDPEEPTDPEEQPVTGEVQVTPAMFTIPLGQTARFNVTHDQAGTGTWVYDPLLPIVEKKDNTIKVKPNALGVYEITYTINGLKDSAMLYVEEPLPQEEIEIPEEIELPSVLNLLDSSKQLLPLHKYPNIMKRNSRYRGQRESEKVLNDHQEQIFDIRQIHKDMSSLDVLKDTTIDSWFNGIETVSISMKAQENKSISKELPNIQRDTDVDSVRAFNSDVVQLSGNSFEERIVGIYGIKRRMQELDERIAEAERRYREYENAYE